ncbi:MAG: DNA repair protein RecN [uncultured Chloroflexia bacterium]|uniref:DNA repair protein RecN n=1 Tax=uncultured Chloroflexia bacterium TaxID=1672391 RepID=A0A6J4H9S2_9CHLR|nr:MAG: DNA repair protein RecN [uncultured Chloroflexia bacterium]
MSEIKEFFVCANGDHWSLEVSDENTVVVHTANEPSGGHQTRTALSDFLKERIGKPEHAALLQTLGHWQDEVEQQLRNDEADTLSHATAMEYLRLGGRRLAKVDDNIVSTRAWEEDPSDAEAFWQAYVEPLGEEKRREVALHLPSISER